MCTSDKDATSAPAGRTPRQPVRRALGGGLIATLSVMSIAPCVAKDAKPGPLLKAVGAPSGLELRGSARSRLEVIDGQFRPNRATSDLLWSARTTLFAAYKRGIVRIGGELVDARGYGEKANSSVGSGEIDALELSQAFATIDLGASLGQGTKAVVTGGRFTLDIGSGRLVGRADFPNTVNSFTGLNLDLSLPGKDRIFAFWAMPQTRLPADAPALHHNVVQWDRESSALQLFGMSYLKAQLRAGVSGEVYGYRLAERDSADAGTRDRRLVTLGGRLFRAPGTGFDFDIEAAYQFGKARATNAATDVTDLDVSAGFAHAELGRSIKVAWAPRVSLHFDYASGDGGKSGKLGRFDPLFGMRRADLGPSGLYGPLSRSNLVSVGARVDVTPSNRWDGFVSVQKLWLDSASDTFSATGVRDRGAAAGRDAGVQVEGRARYWMIPKLLRLDLGAAYLGKGHFLRAASNAAHTGDTHYLYFDAAVTF